ncbi:hypothetical protein Pla52o_33870 [Novipirellula galeiformis]|uniref:HPt domain-containing protein n=1 Tax=Novipirellula galeiformis TaxID=2528004 RepID=A0A5C6CGC7_9BACT|nr:hypothetical protein [Novipirellula galeiformis]TWU22331.1 hypothetical protein Pla52o_33870 [Novipirellula galeiformis]
MLTIEQTQRFQEAIKRIGGDRNLLVTLASLVSDDAARLQIELDRQLLENRFLEAVATGHALQGMLSTFEVGSPVIELRNVISVLRSGDGDRAKVLWSDCKLAIDSFIHEVNALANSA